MNLILRSTKIRLHLLLENPPVPIKEIKIRGYKKPSVHVSIWFKPSKRNPKGGFMKVMFGGFSLDELLAEYPEYEKYVVRKSQ